MSLATPEMYEVPRDSPDWKTKVEGPIKQFQGRVLYGFSRDEGAKIFAAMADLEGQDDLFQKYREVSELPMRERRAAFGNASPKNKSDLWRVHLALYIAKHPEINEAQKVIILEGMSLATPELFDVRFDNPEWKTKVTEPLRQFKNHALGVFSKEEAGKAFATIGDPQYPDVGPRVKPSTASQVSSRQLGYESRSDMFTLSRFAATNFDCSCNRDESWCGAGYHCGNDGCDKTVYGCGYFWLNTCNGGCLRNDDD